MKKHSLKKCPHLRSLTNQSTYTSHVLTFLCMGRDKIIIIVFFYALSESKIIIYVSFSFSTLSKKIQFQSIKKKTKIDFSADSNINVNSFQTSQRTFKSEKKYRSKNKSLNSKFVFKSSTKKNKNKKKQNVSF